MSPSGKSSAGYSQPADRTASAAGHTGSRSALWLSWNEHRRTTGLCKAWGIPLEVLRAQRHGISRWPELAARTLAVLRQRRPQVLYVQCPSVALTTLVALFRPVFGYYLVVDAHNEGVRPFDRPYAAVRWLSRRLLRAADTTIVSNEALAIHVTRAGGRPVVLPDPLPEPAPGRAPGSEALGQPDDVAVVATFRPDEPIDAIVAAAAMLPDVRFAFSGPAERYACRSGELPPNVRLTGFLADREYWGLLERSRVVCDLTLKPDCLVCGAYEALALGKAMVLSDNEPTRRLFGRAARLTDPAPENIAEAIRGALEQYEWLESASREVRERYRAAWQELGDQAIETIDEASRRRIRSAV